jgi:hypothetical protein
VEPPKSFCGRRLRAGLGLFNRKAVQGSPPQRFSGWADGGGLFPQDRRFGHGPNGLITLWNAIAAVHSFLNTAKYGGFLLYVLRKRIVGTYRRVTLPMNRRGNSTLEKMGSSFERKNKPFGET